MCNLHYEWDIGLIEHTGRSEADYVSYVQQLAKANHLETRAGGTPEDWANESFNIAKKILIKDGGAVDEDYYNASIAAVDERLVLGGMQLAKLRIVTLGESKP